MCVLNDLLLQAIKIEIKLITIFQVWMFSAVIAYLLMVWGDDSNVLGFHSWRLTVHQLLYITDHLHHFISVKPRRRSMLTLFLPLNSMKYQRESLGG